MKADVGVIGLGVMGLNIARNIASRGFRVAVYNRTTSVTEEAVESFPDANFIATKELSEFVESLEAPRRILVMVKAGSPVDAVIEQLSPLLQKGDTIADGGNSFYRDTVRREEALRAKGLHFIGVGVSGGEEGALLGPSIMPGGSKESYAIWESVFTQISAKAEGACVTHLGGDGAGHFVKMVHNGIEYADMQLIAETYAFLRLVGGLNNAELHNAFSEFNAGRLSSFLIEITAKIFAEQDPQSGDSLVDKILDKAGQKGTGRWTAQEALEYGVSVPGIEAAVQARNLSSRLDERKILAGMYPAASRENSDTGETADLVALAEAALYAGKLLVYAQGMELIEVASRERGWGVDLGETARIWMGGCIIRAELLKVLRQTYAQGAESEKNLLFSGMFQEALPSLIPALRSFTIAGMKQGIAMPCFASSLGYFDALTTSRLPQNLIQAQRDFFGAHTFERVDKEGVFHHEWGAA